MALVISHAAAEGTLIEGTSKGDKSIPILKSNGWRWSRNLGSWYIQRSRDTAPKWHIINSTAEALRDAGFTVDVDAGFTVDVDVDDTYRTSAEVDADKIARQNIRPAVEGGEWKYIKNVEASVAVNLSDLEAATQAVITCWASTL